MVGGVLLAPGAAYAATATITITGATPANGFGGTSLDVQVSTSGGSGGSFSVSGAGGGCSGQVNPVSGAGSCDIGNVAAGNYSLVASYEGASSPSFPVTVAAPNPAPSNPAPTTPPTTPPSSPPTNPPSSPPSTPPTTPPTTNQPSTTNDPSFTTDAPPLSGTGGQSYSYTFHANGSSSYTLGGGAPSWLSISASGQVYGTPPNGTNSFSFSVVASNNWGSITAGPFTVNWKWGNGYGHHNRYRYVNVYTSLNCPYQVYTGQRATCTLWVHNSGQNFAAGVTAQINLPYQLRADYCGYYSLGYYSWNSGCSLYGNTASENLGTLYPGQTKSLSVTFTAQSGFNLFGRHPGYQFGVRVTGSASSYGNWGGYSFFGQRQGYSSAYVRIIPRGIWWFRP